MRLWHAALLEPEQSRTRALPLPVVPSTLPTRAAAVSATDALAGAASVARAGHGRVRRRAATRDAGGARPLTHADPVVLMSAVLTSY
jgi:hypothetical protein